MSHPRVSCFLFRLLCMVLPGLLLPAYSQTQPLQIGTGSVTGVYYPAGGAICRLLNKYQPTRLVHCTVDASGGSLDNLQGLREGKYQVGIVQSDIQQAAPYFRQQGALGFINSFVNNALPGMKHPITGVVDVLELIYNAHPQHHGGLTLAVSHDTIIAAMLAVMRNQMQLEKSDWPEMMEGVFVWFEGDNFTDSVLKWIWRGKIYQLSIREFVQQKDNS